MNGGPQMTATGPPVVGPQPASNRPVSRGSTRSTPTPEKLAQQQQHQQPLQPGVPMPTVILQQGPMPGPLPQVQRTQPVMYAQQPVVMAPQQPPQGGPVVLVPQAAAARGQQGYAVGPLQPQYQIGPAGHAAHQPNHGQQQATAAAAQAQAQQAAMLAQQRSQQVMQQQQVRVTRIHLLFCNQTCR